MVLSNVNVSRYIRFIMNSQTLRERNFVSEHNGLLFKYKEKIILLGSGQPREVFDLANDESSNTPATVKSAVENDWILTNLTNYNRNNFGRNTPIHRVPFHLHLHWVHIPAGGYLAIVRPRDEY